MAPADVGVEGAGGIGVQLAQRLVADGWWRMAAGGWRLAAGGWRMAVGGWRDIDVPPKLSTRARIFDVGHGRKNDPTDARTVAVVALRTRNLRQVMVDDEMVAIRPASRRSHSGPLSRHSARVSCARG
jgi:hypothetical protein